MSLRSQEQYIFIFASPAPRAAPGTHVLAQLWDWLSQTLGRVQSHTMVEQWTTGMWTGLVSVVFILPGPQPGTEMVLNKH